MKTSWCCVLLAMSVAALAIAADSDIDVAVRGVMTRYLRFGVTELADLERGRTARHSLEALAAGEIGVAGAVLVNAPKARFMDRARDIVRFKRGPDVLQIGRFSNPPKIEDLAALTVDADDFDPRSCRLHDCDTRLPADVIQRIEREFDSNAPDADARASALFKQLLLDNVSAYVSGGPGRMLQYDDGFRPIGPVDEFVGILQNMPAIGALVPGLPEHLRGFPEQRVAGAEDFLYWSKEKFGIAPFITVTHVTIVCGATRTCVMTTKDVYSSRYIDASVALTVASESARSPNAFYLVYANRSRANALKGRFSGLRRTIAERRARASVDENLKALKAELEKGP